jgi:hypothetical protein
MMKSLARYGVQLLHISEELLILDHHQDASEVWKWPDKVQVEPAAIARETMPSRLWPGI